MQFREARLSSLTAAALSLGMLACTGTIGAPGSDKETPGGEKNGGDGSDLGRGEIPGNPVATDNPKDDDFRPPVYQCGGDPVVKQQPLRRLTRQQLVNTITSVVTDLLPTDASAVLNAVQEQIGKLPPDKYTSQHNKGRDGFMRSDMDVSQLHADSHLELAIRLGAVLTETPARRAKLFGACATDSDAGNDVGCVDGFIRDKGPIVLRAPVTDQDVTFYRKAMRGTAASQQALADVVALLLASPRVQFLIESESVDQPLPAHELAARLAYHLWDSPPDADLRRAAADGTLDSPDGYRSQVERMLDDGRAVATVEDFFRQWFSLYLTADLTASLRFGDYAALVADAKPTPSATPGMIDDVLGMVRSIYNEDRPMMDFVTDRRVYTNDAFVGQIYGTTPGDEPVAPDSDQRVGLITRAAFVATGDYSTHPILKGVRLRTQLLCDSLGDPPADAMDNLDEKIPQGPLTQRQEAEAVTSPAGCAACHKMINGLGYATENFDSLGRERSMEVIHDAEGKVLAEVPVDTKIVPNVDDLDVNEVEGPAGLMKSILRSRKVEACFSAQYVRFAFGKISEDTKSDGCVLSDLESVARQGGSIRDLMLTLAESPAFTHRRVDL